MAIRRRADEIANGPQTPGPFECPPGATREPSGNLGGTGNQDDALDGHQQDRLASPS
jgi:hypothetical protein